MGWLKLDVIFRPTVRISGPDFDDPDFNRPDFDGPDFDRPDFDGPDSDGPDFDGPDFTMAPGHWYFTSTIAQLDGSNCNDLFLQIK